MGFQNPTYDTYQDVKTTLARWSSPIWALAIWTAWRFVLESTHRDWLVSQLPELAAWARELGAFGASAAIGVIVAQVMVHFIEVHDHIYDRYFVHWRRQYVTNFIIPELLSPVLDSLPENSLEVATNNWRTCMKKVFYYFAADRDMKIRKNLLVRFYERITKYWLTQLAEVAILLLAFFSLLYAILVSALTAVVFSFRFVWLWLVLLFAFALIRRLAIILRSSVQRATADEIEAIQSHPEYESQLKAFCDEVGLPFNAEH